MEELFSKHRALWEGQLPKGVSRLPEGQTNPYREANSWTLRNEQGEEQQIGNDSHEQEGARSWEQQLPKGNKRLLIAFGLGPTCYLEAMVRWLEDSEGRYLFVLEEETDPLCHFLASSCAHRWLCHERFYLFYGADLVEQQNSLLFPLARFRQEECSYLPIAPYLRHKPEASRRLAALLADLFFKQQMIDQEMATYGLSPQENFYSNVRALPFCRSAVGLHGSFTAVPAIICGAGPSLVRHKELLQQLKARALLLAGGTAINALNGIGIDPHMGVGIDPNSSFAKRIAASTSWMVPFIFHYRMHRKAVEGLFGDKLLLHCKGAIGLDEWFHRQLGLELGELIAMDPGNVAYVSAQLAIAMGCNPLIFVGLDLAHTGGKAYADGLALLATQQLEVDFTTHRKGEELVRARDIYGEPVMTLPKWLDEARSFGRLARSYPEVKFINCTEGGIGFPSIPNEPLEQVAHRWLNKSYPVELALHTAVQRCEDIGEKVSVEQVDRLLMELKESFFRCRAQLYEQQEAKEEPQLEQKLGDEVAYSRYLKVIQQYYERYFALASFKLPFMKPAVRSQVEASQQRRLMAALTEACQANIVLLEALPIAASPQLMGSSSWPKELKVSHRQEASSGLCKVRVDSKGRLQGRALFYYGDGSLYASNEFLDGLAHGDQHYYYKKGQLRAHLRKFRGLLEGEQTLFSPEGQQLRSIHFHRGLRDGSDLQFDREGHLLYQAEWKVGKVRGVARQWYQGGDLECEYRYDAQGKLVATEWHHPLGAFFAPGQSSQTLSSQELMAIAEQLYKAIRPLISQIEALANALYQILGEQAREGLSQMRQERDQLASMEERLDELVAWLELPALASLKGSYAPLLVRDRSIESALEELFHGLSKSLAKVALWTGKE